MFHDTTRKHPGIGTVLIAAVAAAQVLAFSIAATPDLAGRQRSPQGVAPALLPEIVVTAPRIES
jgi:hypothetical protein